MQRLSMGVELIALFMVVRNSDSLDHIRKKCVSKMLLFKKSFIWTKKFIHYFQNKREIFQKFNEYYFNKKTLLILKKQKNKNI